MRLSPRRGSADVSGVIITVCAVLVTALAIRAAVAPATATLSAPAPSFEVISDGLWRDITADRTFYGPEEAPVTLVEFEDFECPACAAFAPRLDSLMIRYEGSIRVAFAHYPLSYHKQALAAARSAECAKAQGQFVAMRRTLYAAQDSLGAVPWSDLARSAGVPDLNAFERCVSIDGPIMAVARDTVLAHRVGLRATPMVLVNGVHYVRPPTMAQLDSIVSELAGLKEPKL